MHLKPEMRVLGVDDSPLVGKEILVIGVVMRGPEWLEGVLRTHIEKDGMDATENIAAMVTGSKHFGQVRAVMLNGVTFGGFNVVDIEALFEATGIPVIVVTRDEPDMERIRSALENVDSPEKRYDAILKAGTTVKIQTTKGKPIFIQSKGIDVKDAKELVMATSVHSRIPEPIRVAHIIATGVVLGESSRRA